MLGWDEKKITAILGGDQEKYKQDQKKLGVANAVKGYKKVSYNADQKKKHNIESPRSSEDVIFHGRRK